MANKLLLVDGDLFLAEVLKKQFLQEGVGEFRSTSNINDAMSLIHSFKPDILLLNISLPDGSGTGFCNHLRQNGFEKPIIMFVENGNQNLSIGGLNAGANDYITKPVRINELFTRIKIQLRKSSSKTTRST